LQPASRARQTFIFGKSRSPRTSGSIAAEPVSSDDRETVALPAKACRPRVMPRWTWHEALWAGGRSSCRQGGGVGRTRGKCPCEGHLSWRAHITLIRNLGHAVRLGAGARDERREPILAGVLGHETAQDCARYACRFAIHEKGCSPPREIAWKPGETLETLCSSLSNHL
jgi:hypothetical protein